jgi:N-acetylmuramoyl-L-alanine amidase
MPWNDHLRRPVAARIAGTAILLLLLLTTTPSAEEKQLSVYGPQVSYSLSVTERNGQDYVGLLEALEPLGNVSASTDGDKWKLRFNNLDAEFRQDRNLCKVAGRKFGLPGPFALEGNRGLVPLRALPAIFGLMLDTKTEYHEAARRLFLGGVATRFTTDLHESGLKVNFSAPVNPLISTEPGKLTMTFTRDPVVASTYTLKLENPLVSSLTFSENNGRAELVLQGRVPLLAHFAADRRTIDILPAPSEAQNVAPAAAPATPNPSVSVPPPPTLQSLTARPPFVVMLDPAHGGDDRGALLSDRLEEKAVTLALARRLRSELQNRGISVIMSRDADVTVPVDQRAAMADAARVALYLCLHVGPLGRGVRVYTAMLDSATVKPGAFLPWDTAQAEYVFTSRALADIVKVEMGKHDIPSLQLPAPLKPLNNVAAAAIGIEVAPSGADIAGLGAGLYQQRIASAVADAIVVGRPQVDAAR